jgi:membrane-associated phospholipid phosphatase
MSAPGTPAAASQRTVPLKMTRCGRLAWLLALLAVQFLYFPLNRLVQGGVALRIPVLDNLVPLWPVWILPYLLSIVWWTACFLWAAWQMEADLYRALMSGAIAVMFCSYLFYLFFPTYVMRPEVTGSGFFYDIVRLVYGNDRVYNAFPSGHTYNAVLLALFWWRWKPRLRWLWVTIAALTVLSTLFTGQHHVADPLGGALLAWLGYRLGLWWAARHPRGG